MIFAYNVAASLKIILIRHKYKMAANIISSDFEPELVLLFVQTINLKSRDTKIHNNRFRYVIDTLYRYKDLWNFRHGIILKMIQSLNLYKRIL